ncbi:MAG: response regulator [bacterium]
MEILVVDDEKQACSILEQILTDLGQTVTIVTKGKDVLDVLRRHTFDMIFVDINMPDISGIDVIKQIRAENSEIKIIVVSAVDNELAIRYIGELGINGYITKPIRIKYLEKAIKDTIKKIL